MQKKITLACFVALFIQLTATTTHAAGYFKCKDENGNIIFSDTECPTEAEILTEKTLRADALTGRFAPEAYQGDGNMSLEDMLKMRHQLGEALAAMAPIKMAASEHYLSQAEWPGQLEAMGFDPDRTNSEHIDSVVIGQDGKLIAKLRDSLGEDKMIVLSPREAMDGTLIEWDCAANFSPILMNELSCESRKIHP